MVSFPKYVNFSQPFTLDSAQQLKNFNAINISQKAILLKEDKVKSLPVRVKGDTLEYNAKDYKTSVNASVEDLFSQLYRPKKNYMN